MPSLVHMPRLAVSVLKLYLLCRLDAAALREGKGQSYMIQSICFAPGGQLASPGLDSSPAQIPDFVIKPSLQELCCSKNFHNHSPYHRQDQPGSQNPLLHFLAMPVADTASYLTMKCFNYSQRSSRRRLLKQGVSGLCDSAGKLPPLSDQTTIQF